MKVKLTRNVFVKGKPLTADKVVDLQTKDARLLISINKAIEYEAPPKKKATKDD